MKTAFVILAGGEGRRLGGQPKQFRLLSGLPLWQWSLRTALQLQKKGLIHQIVAVFPAHSVPPMPEGAPVSVAAGGSNRALSVLSALRAAKTADAVLLHDAARPFISEALCTRLIRSFHGDNGVIPLLPEANALKKIVEGRITPVDREGLYITQTPQVFPVKQLTELIEKAESHAYKDEAELWLQSQRQIDFVEGESMNFKVTEESDWHMAQLLAPRPRQIRNGLGYDVHPLVPGRAFVLGGVRIPCALGPQGHSDADALCHAVSDALLSAAGMPDIGTLYPADCEAYKDHDSTLLLKDVLRRISEGQWKIEYVSAVVSCQIPRLAPYKDRILQSLREVLETADVNVTFKSGEHIGPAGRAEAVFVWASATLSR